MDSVLLVELKDPSAASTNREQVLNELYPTIEGAWRKNGNKSITRVARSYVILASPQKAFVRTGKGSVSKSKTIDLFQSEIAELDLAIDARNNGHRGVVRMHNFS